MNEQAKNNAQRRWLARIPKERRPKIPKPKLPDMHLKCDKCGNVITVSGGKFKHIRLDRIVCEICDPTRFTIHSVTVCGWCKKPSGKLMCDECQKKHNDWVKSTLRSRENGK